MEGPVRPYQPTSSSIVASRRPRRSLRCGRSANAISPATRLPPIWRPTNGASAQHQASWSQIRRKRYAVQRIRLLIPGAGRLRCVAWLTVVIADGETQLTKRWWWVVLVAVLFVLTPGSVGATAQCEFILGFATLKAALDEVEGPQKVGACLENQRFAANGNAEQRTTGGLLVWRKQDNFTAFTDGYRTWVNGPQGLQVRLNTESFAWEPPRSYRGVALGDREDNADLRAWIDRFGTLGHGENSYDHWVSAGKPRDTAEYPAILQEEERRLLTAALHRLDHISAEELDEKRQQLIRFIWREAGFPAAKTPHAVAKGISDPRYAFLDNLASIERIEVQMEFGMDSIIYLFRPRSSNGRLLIYHQGHEEDFFRGVDTIHFFLRHGYTVAQFAMPLLGMNSQPVIASPDGNIVFRSHDFRVLESEDFSPLKFFVEPVTVFLNYAVEEYRYDLVAMVGLSGGGWTTTLVAALDPRIARSYPVAGTLPLYFASLRDYEQTHPGLYAIANYLELYVLGSYGGHVGKSRCSTDMIRAASAALNIGSMKSKSQGRRKG